MHQSVVKMQPYDFFQIPLGVLTMLYKKCVQRLWHKDICMWKQKNIIKNKKQNWWYVTGGLVKTTGSGLDEAGESGETVLSKRGQRLGLG